MAKKKQSGMGWSSIVSDVKTATAVPKKKQSGMGWSSIVSDVKTATAVPKSKPVSATTTKDATIWAAENTLPPAALLAPVPKSRKATPSPLKPSSGKPTAADLNRERDRRYRLALAAPVSPKAQIKLAQSMDPAKKAAVTGLLKKDAQDAANYDAAVKKIKGESLLGDLGHTAHLVGHALETGVKIGKTIGEGAASVVPTVRSTPYGPVVTKQSSLVTVPQATVSGVGAVGRAAGTGLAHDAGKAVTDLLTSSRLAATPTAGPSLGVGTGSQKAALEAAPIPAPVAEAIPKVLAGGVGAVASVRHPIAAATATYHELGQALRGTTQFAGLGVMLMSPSISSTQKAKVATEVLHGLVKQLQEQYGSNVSIADAFHAGEKEPFIYGTNAVALADPALKALDGLAGLSGVETLGEADRILTYQTKGAKLAGSRFLRPVRGEPGEKVPVVIPQSRSPLTRALIQKPYDVVSRITGLENPRAARALRRQMNRDRMRMPAEARSVFRDAEYVMNRNLVGGQPDKHIGAALAVLMQKPAGFTDDEWMQATMADIQQMIDTGRFSTPDGKLSPGVQRLVNRTKRYETQEEMARTRRRARASTNIHDEQLRLSDALADISEKRSQVLEAKRQGDPAHADAFDAAIRALDNQAKVAKEELDGLTIDQPSVSHPARTELIDTATKQGMDPTQIEDATALLDARARVWANQTGRDPGEWYQGLETRAVQHPTEIPDVALRQPGAPSDAKLPPLEDLRKIAFKGVDMSVFRGHNIDEFLKNIPSYLERGAPHRMWYENSAEAMLKHFGGNKELADKMAQLTAIYSASRAPVENVNLALEAYRQWVAGRPIDVGTASQSEKANLAMKGEDWGSRKTNRFYGNMLEDIDPERFKQIFKGGEVTNDIWMARLFGLKTDQPTPREYEAMTQITQNIADALGWKPKQVQAALWVPAKADAGRAVVTGKGTRGRVPMTDAEAGGDFADALAQESAIVPFEAAPGYRAPNQELLRNYDDLSPSGKLRYTHEKAQAVEDFIHESGLFGVLHGEGVGFYKNETNPAFSIAIPSPLAREGGPVSWTTTRGKRALDEAIGVIGDALNQDAMAWFRPVYRRDPITKQNGILARLSRPLTEEETRHLVRELKKRLEGDVAVPPGAGDDLYVLNFSPASNRDFHEHVDAVLQEIGEAGEDLHNDQVRFRFDGNLKTRSRYGQVHVNKQIGEAGRPDVRQAADRLRARSRAIDEHYLRAPGGRAKLDDARGLERPADLAASRRQDVRGAVQWLDSAAGKRILYLTPHADGSTILHELVGHATDEMHALYPDEFAEVETEIGKPYADWTTEDHEQFARWAERYFTDGHPPTPELVDAMERTKRWMRTIYQGMMRMLGRRIPTATRALFDTYFGGYADETVSRIATYMGREHWGKEDLSVQRYGGAKALAKTEAATLRKSVETRRYNRSLDGMVNELDDLTKQMDDLTKKGEELSPEEHDRMEQLSADILRQQGEITVRASKREMELRAKLRDLEKAMAQGVTNPENRRFQGALEAMKWLSADREKILQEALGPEYDQIMADRKDLLADWLVDRGLLEPDYEHGTGSYFPHQLDESFWTQIKQPAASLTSSTVGKTKMDLLKMHKRNQMILWQRGDWSADPAVLMQAHSRAQAYAWMTEVKRQLWDMGRPITQQEKAGLVDGSLKDVYVINPDGKALSPELRSQLKANGATGTKDVQDFLDGVEAGDNDRLEHSLKGYWEAFAIDPDHLPPGFDWLKDPNLRVVPKNAVHAIMRPLRGGATTGGKALDVGSTMARYALVYGNVPGYMIANGAGNLALLLAQQGWRLPQMMGRARLLFNNRKLYDRVQAETGDLPAYAAISKGRAYHPGDQAARAGHGILHFESKVDRMPRAVAWLYEANKRGYKTESDLFRLLDGKTPKAARDREIVADAATNHMIDFNRPTDFERQTITRALFLWPYVRGATAWPFWYAKNFPGRAAVANNFAQVLEKRREEMLGPTPPWYDSLFPVSGKGRFAKVINANSASPTSMATASLQLIGDSVASALGKQPDTQTSTWVAQFAPLLQDVINSATLKDDFGRAQSLQQTLEQVGFDMVPGVNIGKALKDSSSTPRVFRAKSSSLEDRALRTFIRLAPETASIPWLNMQAQKQGTKSMDEQIDDAVTQSQKDWASFTKDPYNQTVRRGVVTKIQYAAAVQDYAKRKERGNDYMPHKAASGTWEPHYNPTAYERAQIAYNVLRQQYPGAEIPSPNSILVAGKTKPNTEEGKLLMARWMSVVYNPYVAVATRNASAAKKVRSAKKLEAGK